MEELNWLQVEEVWDRAGPTRHGYVEPGEAADQMIEEVLEPFLEELDMNWVSYGQVQTGRPPHRS